MLNIISVSLFLIALTMGSHAYAQDENNEYSGKPIQPVTFKFIDENGKPINGSFTLHETEKGEFVKNWYRLKPLNQNGEIAIDKLPPEFRFGVTSDDEFYENWVKSGDVDLSTGQYLHRCTPSGAIKFEMAKLPTDPYKVPEPVVVEFHLKKADESYGIVKGIGIFPADREYVVGGLEPGVYFIVIKFDYEDKNPLYKSAVFKVKIKEYTSLPKIEITEDVIANSKL